MKVLITGAAGQVGRTLLRLAPQGISVVALAHADFDIADEHAVTQRVLAETPSVIINAAAYTAVDKAESEPDLAWRVNAAGPGNLARAADRTGARLIHISTDFVFDGQSSMPYKPDAKPNPLSSYGRSKLEGETAVLQHLPERSLILRTAWVYSAEGRNFMLTMLRLMKERKHVRVVADQIGSPTSARSIAATIWKLVAQRGLGGVHHLTDAGVASWYDFAVAIAEEAITLGLLPADVRVTPISTEEYPTPARRPSYSVLDNRSLGAALGVEPVHWRTQLRGVLRELQHA